MFSIFLQQRDFTRKIEIDLKIVDRLEFEESEIFEQKLDLIIDSMIFAKKDMNNRPPQLYYFIYQKKKMHEEVNWDLFEKIAHLRRLIKKITLQIPKISLLYLCLLIKLHHHHQ